MIEPGGTVDGLEREGESALPLHQAALAAGLWQSDDAIVLLDERARIIEWNPGAEAVFGFPRAEVLGRAAWEVQLLALPEDRRSPEAQERIRGIILDFLEREEIPHDYRMIETRLRRPDGEERFIQTSVFASRGETGMALGTISRDVTDRRRAEEGIERRLRMERLVTGIEHDFLTAVAHEVDVATDRTLAALGELAGVDRCYVFRFREQGARMDNTHEWCDVGIEPQRESLQDLPTSAVPWWMEHLRRLKTIYVPLVAAMPEEASAERGVLEAQGIQSLVVMPISSGEELLGFLGFDSVVEPRAWSPEDLELLAVVADIIGSALRRSRVEETLRARVEWQAGLLQTARGLTDSLDLNEVLQRIGGDARRLLRAFGCAIYLLEADGETLRPVVSIEPPYEEEILATPLPVSHSFTGRAVQLRRGVVFNDAPGHPLGHQIPGTPAEVGQRERVIAAPFIVDDRVLGAMCLNRLGVSFTEEDLTLAETFAAYAATALKNAQTFDLLQREMQERRAAERALRESEAQFRALAEHSGDVISRFDRENRVLYVNPAIRNLTGRPPEEYLGRTYRESGLAPQYTDRWDVAVARTFETGRPHRELRSFPGTEGVLALDWLLVPEFAEDGSVATVLSTSRDVSDLKRVEEALRERERFLDTLMGNLPGMVYRCRNDAHWTMAYVSDGCLDLTGYTPEDLLENAVLPYREVIHLEDRQMVRAQVKAGIAHDELFQVEYRIRTRDGREKWVWERGRATGPGSSILEGFITDITERKQSEEGRAAMYGLAQAALVAGSREELCASIHGIVRRLMPADNLYVALYDAKTDSVSLPYHADQYESSFPHQSRRAWRGMTEYVLRTGTAILATAEDIWALDAQGEVSVHGAIPESYLAAPLKDDAGRSFGVIAVQSYDPAVTYSERERDLLDFASSQIAMGMIRKQAEEEVRQERDFAQSLLDTARAVIVLLDLEGRVLSLNAFAEQLTGMTSEQARGVDWVGTLVPERERGNIRGVFAQSLKEGSVQGYTNPVLAADGRERLIEWYGATSRAADGEVIGFLATGHDITERMRLEEQLRQSQKMEMVGQLAGGIAHDFNNLLTAIIGHAQFALESLPVGDVTRSDVEQVLKASDRASSLTQQLLAFSRRQIIEPRDLDLNELMFNAGKLLRRLIGENIELVTVASPMPPVVRADPVQLEQVLINLVVNARDAMPDEGTLTMETALVDLDEDYTRGHLDTAPGPYVLLAVSDTGTGMTPEVKAHLFEPFFTTKQAGKGTGLGLATTYGIVRQHGGSIWVYSEPGHGATFKIYLPRVAGAAERMPRRDDTGFLPRGEETVLVVEDESGVRNVVCRLLREQGYTVLEASEGQKALEIAEEHGQEIGLLVTDVVMPRMGGKELADTLRERLPNLPVLFVSGYTDNGIVHRGVLSAGTAFLQKPFTVSALARKVRAVLDAD